jgi:hypothetical protein
MATIGTPVTSIFEVAGINAATSTLLVPWAKVTEAEALAAQVAAAPMMAMHACPMYALNTNPANLT